MTDYRCSTSFESSSVKLGYDVHKLQ